jgi:hypothetical protein
MWSTFTNTRTVEGDQTQVQSPSQLIVECHEISGETHAETAENDVALGVADLGKGDGAARRRVRYSLGEFRRKDIIINSQVDRVRTGWPFSVK